MIRNVMDHDGGSALPGKKRSKTDFIVTKLKVNETVSDKTNPALLKWFILRRKDRLKVLNKDRSLFIAWGGGGGGRFWGKKW